MKYHVRLSKMMRNLELALMVCVLMAGIAGTCYGVLAANTGIWKFWQPAGYVFAVGVLVVSFVIVWNGYCEITTRIIVYPGRKIIVHKGQSVKVYPFDQLMKPKPVKKSPRSNNWEQTDQDDKYGLSMVVRLKSGKKICKLSTSFKYVRRLEDDLRRYL